MRFTYDECVAMGATNGGFGLYFLGGRMIGPRVSDLDQREDWMPINTSKEMSDEAKLHLMRLLNTRGYVQIGCGAPAVGFAEHAEREGVPVTMEEEGGMMVIRRKE